MDSVDNFSLKLVIEYVPFYPARKSALWRTFFFYVGGPTEWIIVSNLELSWRLPIINFSTSTARLQFDADSSGLETFTAGDEIEHCNGTWQRLLNDTDLFGCYKQDEPRLL